MISALRPSALALFIGDIFFFTTALWLTLFLRSFSTPSAALFEAHLIAFAPLFAVWTLVYVVAGLYEGRRIILARRALSATLLYAQTFNIIIAALVFFFVPAFGISPKVVLLIYLVVSFLLILLWRAFLFPKLGIQKREAALIIGEGKEIEELAGALRLAPLSPVTVAEIIRPAQAAPEAVAAAVAGHQPRFIVVDFDSLIDPHAFPGFYTLLTQGVRFIDAQELYEEVFGRVPLSSVNNKWLARNISQSTTFSYYALLKRTMDILVALIGGAVSLVLYPLIVLAILLDDGFPVFVKLDRVGKGDSVIPMYKFRSMSGNDNAAYGAGGKTTLTVTRVGRFLRSSRLDELPQLLNVLLGQLSLIGPRPESPSLVALYEKEIPYYALRHLIVPGLSGSAQLYYHGDPHHAADVDATRMKLSYDLFYLKHRSFSLDLSIAIKTVRRLLIKSNS